LGDAALASVLAVHNLAMSGGLVDAVERSTSADLDAATAGFRWLRLEAAADVIASVRLAIEAGALDDDDTAQSLEGRADDEYARVVPTDQTLVDAFQVRFADDPFAFAPV
jgi:hypothetical protein